MRQKKFKNITNKADRKRAKKTYYKLRKSQKKHRDLIKAKERQEKKRKHLGLIRRSLKKIEISLKEKSPSLSDLEKLFSQAQKVLDEAAQKGIIHKNNNSS